MYKFQLYCPDKNKIEFECHLHNEALIGRLSIGMYTFTNGHIYFGNTVIKIRYDLIENNEG